MFRRLIALAPVAFGCLVLSVPSRAGLITPIPIPTFLSYDSLTTPIDISGLDDFSSNSSISGGGLMVMFTPSMVRLSIPTTWASWGSPPETDASVDSCPGLGINCPPVLWSNGSSSVTMTLSSPKSVFGFEAEPDNPTEEPMTVTFFGIGGSINSFQLTPSGDFGALLFAASSNDPFTKVTLSNDLGDDFAIANVRFLGTPLPIPEPRSVPLAVIGLAGIGIARKLLQNRHWNEKSPPARDRQRTGV
jgi:hypothetical protein